MSQSLPLPQSERRSGPYTASAAQTVFTVTFPFLAAEDLQVLVRASAEDEWAVASLATDYSVAGVQSPSGGTITFGTARALGSQVRIDGLAPITSTTDVTPAGTISSVGINRFFDRVVMWLQEMRRDVNGALGTVAELAASVPVAVAASAASAAEALNWKNRAQEWAQSDSPISTAAGGNGTTDRSSKCWATASATSATASAASQAATATIKAETGLLVSAAQSAAATSTSAATTSSAAAAAASEAIGATIFATKALADAGLSGISANANVQVLNDETQGGTRTLYRKVSGSYVYVRELGDQSLSSLTERYGFGAHMRYTLSALAKVDREAFGSNGAGNANDFPATRTLSQSGTTITSGTANMLSIFPGTIVRWASGEEAYIADLAATSDTPVSTATAATSQTVSSGTATINPNHVCMVFDGDSLGHRISGYATRWGYRAIGFGGAIFSPGNIDTNEFQFQEAEFGGGAAVVSTSTDYDDFPYSQYVSLPSGGTYRFSFINPYSLGVKREYRLGLDFEAQKIDTVVVTWLRAAGAFALQRKRVFDAAWTTFATVADTSAGSGTYGILRTSVPLSHEWQYRVLGTSGTVKIAPVALLNNSAPGFVPWRVSRGGDTLANFNGLPSSNLAELCNIFRPSARFMLPADGGSSDTTPAAHLAYLEPNTTLWRTAWPYMDHVMIELWEDGGTTPLVGASYDTALRQHALANDMSYIPIYDLFGDYATQSFKLKWVEDLVHPGKTGSAVIWDRALKVTGLDRFPAIAESRNVSARKAEVRALSIAGQDAMTMLDALRMRAPRGAKWNAGQNCRLTGATGGVIGTGDFTLSLEMTVLSTVTAQYIAVVSSNPVDVTTGGGIVVYQDGAALHINLRDGSGGSYIYKYDYFGTAYGGKTGTLTIRSDAANARFDLLWNGMPAVGLVGTVSGAGSQLGTWSGSGTVFAIPQGSASDRMTNFFRSAFWRTRLTDAEILANIWAVAPTSTVPDFWYEFDEGVGRVVRDISGNGRHAQFLGGNPNQYSIGGGPVWRVPRLGQLAPAWKTSVGGAALVFVPGDDVLVSYTDSAYTYPGTLPPTPRVSDTFRVVKAGAAAVRVSQPALQQIKRNAGSTVGTDATTIGTSGYLIVGGAAQLTCSLATYDSGGALTSAEWRIAASDGTISFA